MAEHVFAVGDEVTWTRMTKGQGRVRSLRLMHGQIVKINGFQVTVLRTDLIRPKEQLVDLRTLQPGERIDGVILDWLIDDTVPPS